ncbi:hypothetical protein, conserved [Eimeria necatrix]|uniref:AP2-coincident C-terminal domain-containing protein n=1 Tax=Eimeria necatrix TaxID=51315 RepID=U6MWY1_9EIME|nr:hypothetical protein, conserved [Eimeria necatrix]CDJ68476.1 hypothetical protein, conserved [Eimeria necatrix]
MREVFASCDSKKALCSKLVTDLYRALINSSSSDSSSSSSSSSSSAAYLESELALHLWAIEEAKGAQQLQQLQQYLNVFVPCLVGGLLPSQLPAAERAALLWALRCPLLLPRSSSSSSSSSSDAAAPAVFPFRERQGITHRLLLQGSSSQPGGAPQGPPGPPGPSVGLRSPTAAVGRSSSSSSSSRSSALVPSLLLGPVHAPSSPTAALYGGPFSMATELYP